MPNVYAGAGVAGIAGAGSADAAGRTRKFGMPDFNSPSTWVAIYTIAAVAAIFGMYIGFGGLKGDVLS